MEIWEMLKMFDKNPNLKFKRDEPTPDGKDYLIQLDQEGNIIYSINNSHFSLCLSRKNLKANWELIPESVNFTTVMKAYADGKTIRCFIDENRNVISLNEILNGKWYIEN